MGGDQEVEQGSRPDKRVYELTPAGRAALQRWSSASRPSAPTMPDPEVDLVLVVVVAIAAGVALSALAVLRVADDPWRGRRDRRGARAT